MEMTESALPVAEFQVTILNHKIKHSAVMKADSERVILIYLKETCTVRELFFYFLEERDSEQFVSIRIISTLTELNSHLRLGKFIVIIIHKNTTVECLHIDSLTIFHHGKLFIPLSERRWDWRLIPHIVVYRREKI